MVRTWQDRLGFSHQDDNVPTQSQLFLGAGVFALLIAAGCFWLFGFGQESCLGDQPVTASSSVWNCQNIPTEYGTFFRRSLWCLTAALCALAFFACVRRFSLSQSARKAAFALLSISGLAIVFFGFRFWSNHQTWVYENETGAYGKAFCAKNGPDPAKNGAVGCIGWGLETRSSKPVTTETYDLVQGRLLNHKAFWVKRNGKFAYLNHTGKPITDFVFDDASDFGLYIALVKQGNQYFYINDKGKPVNDGLFDEAATASKQDEFLAVRVGSLWGYVNSQGKVIMAPTFNEVKEARVDLGVIGLPVKKDGRWGLVDRSGKATSNFEFESIDSTFKEGYLAIAACFLAERCGFIGLNGKLKDPRLFRSAVGPVLVGSPGFAVETNGETQQIRIDKN
jgi:WG containing repeat